MVAAVTMAVNLLAELGAEIVDRCQVRCEFCEPALDAVAWGISLGITGSVVG